MNQKTLFEYTVVFIVVFAVSFVAIMKGLQYVQERSLASSSSILAYADSSSENENSTPGAISNSVALDAYAKHLVTVNDPGKGCSCPSCCSTM